MKRRQRRKRLLFICAANQNRSPTAESLFRHSRHYEARSAGLSTWSVHPVTRRDIIWADMIFVMDEEIEHQKTRLLERFPEAHEREVVVLHVPDVYGRGDPDLLLRLRREFNVILGRDWSE